MCEQCSKEKEIENLKNLVSELDTAVVQLIEYVRAKEWDQPYYEVELERLIDSIELIQDARELDI